MRSIVIGLALLLLVSGCATPKIHTWSEGYPKNVSQLSDAEKKDELNKFALVSIERAFGRIADTDVTKLVVRLADDPDRLYSFESFWPVINEVSPAAEGYRKQAADYAFYSNIASAVSILGFVVYPPVFFAGTNSSGGSTVTISVGSGILVVSFSASQILGFLERTSYEDMVREYLNDLNDQIFF